jgi:hypothetical protein
MNPLKWTHRHKAACILTILLGAGIGFASALCHVFAFRFEMWLMALRILFGVFGPGASEMYFRGLMPEAAAGAVLAAICFYIWMLVPPEIATQGVRGSRMEIKRSDAS